MASAEGQLDLHVEADRLAITNALETIGIRLPRCAVETAARELSEDWLKVWPSMGCRLDIGSAEQVVSLPYWAEIVCALDALRTNAAFRKQVRRLRVPSPEKPATALVIAIAGRYLREGYTVEFEPYGDGGGDVLISDSNLRCYIEVKRENWRDQCRSLSIMQRADQVSEALTAALKDKLDASGTRVEIQFSRSFSEGTIAATCAEVSAVYGSTAPEIEVPLNTIRGSRMIVLPRSKALHFRTGLMSLNITVPPESTIQVGEHLAVTVSFNFTPSSSALANNVRKALKQLANDLSRDPLGQGMIVIETMSPRLACDQIRERFLGRLTPAILGVVVIGPDVCIVPRTHLSHKELALMAIAARSVWHRAQSV